MELYFAPILFEKDKEYQVSPVVGSKEGHSSA